MIINNAIINDLAITAESTKSIDEWFKNLKPKYDFQAYIPLHVSQYFKYLMDEDCDFKMKPQKYRREYYIKYLKQNAGLNFLASGTNRMCFTSDIDPDVIIKLAYNSGRMNAENEMFVQDKLKPYVTKTFGATADGIFSLHERVKEIGSKEDLLPFADQHFMIMMDFYERGYMIEDVGTKTFRNLGIRPNFGLVLLDYPTVYQVRAGDLKCACGGRIFYDAGFNRLQCHTCGRAFTAASLSNNAVRNYTELAKLNQQKARTIRPTEYDGGVKMKFSLVFEDENGQVLEENVYDTKNYKAAPKPAEEQKKLEPAPVDDILCGIKKMTTKVQLVFEDGTIFKNEVRAKKDNRNQKKDHKPEPPVQKPVFETPEVSDENTTQDNSNDAFENLIKEQEAEAAEVYGVEIVDDGATAESSEEIIDIDTTGAIDVDDSELIPCTEEEAESVNTGIDETIESISGTLGDIFTDDLKEEIAAMLKEESSNDEQHGHSESIESEESKETGKDEEPKEASKPKRTRSNGSSKKAEQRSVEEPVILDDGVEESSKYPARGRGKKKSARK